MGTFTDDDLRHLLGEAAASYDVPDDAADETVATLAEDRTVVPLLRRRPVQLISAAAAVAVVLLGIGLFQGDRVDRVGQLAGSSGDLQSGAGRVPAAGPEALPNTKGLDDRAFTSDTAGSSGGTAPGASGGTAASAGVAAAAPVPVAGAVAGSAAAVPTDGARIVKKGSVALVVDDGRVSSTLTRVAGFADAVDGLVASGRTEEAGDTPSGSLTLRVPVDAFERVVDQVRGLPGEVKAATTSGQDVTAQYADVETQLRTLKAARERFLTILARANSIGDVLAVQQRVDEVTGRIDRLEGQRRVLADQSDTATLVVTVTEAADEPAVVEPDTGLSKAFSDAWTGFTSGVEGLIRLSGRGVLLLLVLGLGYAAVRGGRRALRRRAL